jgi:hypothetical protein
MSRRNHASLSGHARAIPLSQAVSPVASVVISWPLEPPFPISFAPGFPSRMSARLSRHFTRPSHALRLCRNAWSANMTSTSS